MKNNRLLDKFATQRKGKLLDIIIEARTVKALDKTVDKSKIYQDALKKQNEAFDRVDKAGLSREQRMIVDRAISAVNDCGAVYGFIAYKFGFHDGIKVISEIRSD